MIQLEKALFDEVQNFSARIGELASSARRPSRPSASPSPDIPDQIRKLAKLKDDGIISFEEFEAKKTELLGKL